MTNLLYQSSVQFVEVQLTSPNYIRKFKKSHRENNRGFTINITVIHSSLIIYLFLIYSLIFGALICLFVYNWIFFPISIAMGIVTRIQERPGGCKNTSV